MGELLPALPAASYSKIQESYLECRKLHQYSVWVIRQAHEDKSASKKSRCLMRKAKKCMGSQWQIG